MSLSPKKVAKSKANEEEELLRQYAASSRVDSQATLGQRTFYFFCALLVTATPVWLWHSIYELPVEANAPIYGLVTLFAAITLTLGYHNVAYSLKLKLKRVREDALAKEKKESYDAKKKLQDAVTTREAMAFSVLYNNALFLLSTIILGFYVFNPAPPVYNYILSTGLSVALLTFNSARQD